MYGKGLMERVVLLFMIISIFTVIQVEDATGVGVPAISVMINEVKQYANITATEGDVVTFTGEVEVVVPWSLDMQYVIVNIEGDAGVFETSEIPEMIFSNEIRVLPFSCNVTLPPKVPAQFHEFQISGQWRNEPGTLSGNTDPSTGIIHVSSYYEYEMYPPERVFEMERTKSYDHFFHVINRGNSNDRVVLEVMNRQYLEDNGITVDVVCEMIDLPYEYSVEYPLNIIIGGETRPDEYEIEARVHSANARESGKDFDYVHATSIITVIREIIPPEEFPEEPPEDPPEEPVEEPESPDDDDSVKPETPAVSASDDGNGFKMMWVIVGAAIFIIIAMIVYFIMRSTRITE